MWYRRLRNLGLGRAAIGKIRHGVRFACADVGDRFRDALNALPAARWLLRRTWRRFALHEDASHHDKTVRIQDAGMTADLASDDVRVLGMLLHIGIEEIAADLGFQPP